MFLDIEALKLKTKSIAEKYDLRLVILYGSYAKNKATEKSDVDIAVEIADGKEIRIVNLGVIPNLGYRKNVQINLHIFSRNKIDINLFSNIANGFVLEGFLEVQP